MVKVKKPAKRLTSGKRGGKTRTSWPPGKSGNPAGRPRDGESWAAVVTKIGNLTPTEAAEWAGAMAKGLKEYKDKVTLKELSVLKAFMTAIFESSPGLLNFLADRAEGKAAQAILLADWRQEAKDAGMTPTEVFETLVAEAIKSDATRMGESTSGDTTSG